MYQHKIAYYETDMMKVTHHSNYIRWMEEARVDFLEKLGYPYERLEAEGIISPVIEVECKYKKSTTFAETISIDVWVEEWRGIRLKLGYRMTNEKDEVVVLGHSEHCFLGQDGRPLRMDKEKPEFNELLLLESVSGNRTNFRR